jgi:hypothetical protein
VIEGKRLTRTQASRALFCQAQNLLFAELLGGQEGTLCLQPDYRAFAGQEELPVQRLAGLSGLMERQSRCRWQAQGPR